MFGSIFNTAVGMTDTDILICTLTSLLCGIAAAFTYSRDKAHSKSLTSTLVVLPILVQAVIMMVNGNLGVGVAVMGAFSLIRFRSAQGNAKDITFIFLAMAVGLAAGVGFVTFAAAVTVLLCVIILISNKLILKKSSENERILKINIPEDLDYTGVFDDILSEYTSKNELLSVKTVNLGTMFELKYNITLKDASLEKKMIDAIRCRNGNLTVVCAVEENKEIVL
ncbi:MAG: DUF4956 domain-containing protein [Oscillospiraceae bacterium]